MSTRSPTTKSRQSVPSTTATSSSPAVVATAPVAKNRGFITSSVDMVRSAVLSGTTAMFGVARTFYEAASNAIRLVKAVDAGPNSANGEIERVRMRSRWTYANDPFYRQAVRQIANNTVHYGIKPVIKDKKLQKLWKRWVKEADARGKLDFYGMQWVIALGTARDGEALVRFRQRRPGDTRSGVNFQLQVMEPDHLPLNETKLTEGGNRVTSGVEQDQIEKVVAYWLLDYHPKDQWQVASGSASPRRVAAEEIMHVYMPDRYTGTRGYPWGASGINTSEAMRTYEMYELERKKGSAAHLGILKKPRLAGDEPDEDDGEIGTPPPIEPGSNMVIPDDYEYDFFQPVATDGNYGAYKRENLSAVAVAFGLAVEHITLNFQYLNDRQYRAAMLEVQRYFESLQYHMLVRQLCEPVFRRFVSEVLLNGLWSLPEGMDFEDICDVEWMCPARGYIHPVQEIDAFAKAVANGFTSRKRVAAQFGEDVEDIDAENEADFKRSEGMGLAYAVYAKPAAGPGHNGGPPLEGEDDGESGSVSEKADGV